MLHHTNGCGEVKSIEVVKKQPRGASRRLRSAPHLTLSGSLTHWLSDTRSPLPAWFLVFSFMCFIK